MSLTYFEFDYVAPGYVLDPGSMSMWAHETLEFPDRNKVLEFPDLSDKVSDYERGVL